VKIIPKPSANSAPRTALERADRRRCGDGHAARHVLDVAEVAADDRHPVHREAMVGQVVDGLLDGGVIVEDGHGDRRSGTGQPDCSRTGFGVTHPRWT
jgi:hypothetical protein